MSIEVPGGRVAEMIDALSGIGRVASGGVTRLGLSSDERRAMAVVRGWLDDLGLDTGIDHAGNLRARWEVGDADAPAIATGSHLDSVLEGGHYDGPAGVVAAVAAVEALQAAGRTPPRPVEVLVFTSEEGSRFGIGLMGSTALVHGLTDEQLGRSDREDVTVAGALREVGGDVEAVRQSALRRGDLDAFIEVHIEQATTLEQLGVPVGVVTGIAAPVFLAGRIVGLTDHAGATPMDERRDALAGLAELVLAAEEVAGGTGTTVATVGRAEVLPGSMNAIPGRVEFTIDLRDLDLATRDRVEAELRARLDAICRRRELRGELETLQRERPVPADPDLLEMLTEAVEETGTEVVRLPSGAAHDTMVMAEICPVGMLFVRCRDGLSHTPDEHAEPADIAVAATALAHALLRSG